MNEFFRTIMGRAFFEGTMPTIARELKRLNDNLEADRDQRERMLASAEAQDKYQRDRDAAYDASCQPLADDSCG